MKYNRLDLILKYIVEYFIKNAKPVGSHTLIDEYHLEFSSATIRNDMMELEKAGLIEKNHLSSGRIPSTKGYKYYCEHLRDKNVNDELKFSLQNILDEKIQSIEKVISSSCEIISQMTSLVAVVKGGDEDLEHLANISLVKISETSFTAIFVTDKGYVENKTFIIQDDVSYEDVMQCVKLLNERLAGTKIVELPEKMESIRPVLKDYVISHDIIYRALMETFIRFASDRVSLYGKEELFNNPEFKNDATKLKKVLKMLDNASFFKDINNELSTSDDSTLVKIGGLEGEEDVSLVTTKIKIGEEGENTITLLGPKRMDYDKALSALEYLAEQLNIYFNKKGGNDNGGDA